MLNNNEVISLKEILRTDSSNNTTLKHLKKVFERLNEMDLVYFNTHRDVDWGNTHTQHDKYAAYSRE